MKSINYLAEFLKIKDLQDVKQKVIGELEELSTKSATYFYGNSELIISPSDDSQDEIVYVIDNYGSGDMLVRF